MDVMGRNEKKIVYEKMNKLLLKAGWCMEEKDEKQEVNPIQISLKKVLESLKIYINEENSFIGTTKDFISLDKNWEEDDKNIFLERIKNKRLLKEIDQEYYQIHGEILLRKRREKRMKKS